MNAVIIAVLVMLVLSLLRINVVFSLIIGAIAGGLTGGMTFDEIVKVFTEGLGNNASVALSYGLLGGFAVALSSTGLPNALVDLVSKGVRQKNEVRNKTLTKVFVILFILLIACFSQNVIPVHIAFIPILIPSLLGILNELKIDRRLIASTLAFGLIAPYVLLPYGFGHIFHTILAENIKLAGLSIDIQDIPMAMVIPVLGMVVGLLIAIFISYRKPRDYEQNDEVIVQKQEYQLKSVLFGTISIVGALLVQILLDSMIFGALAGITILYITKALKWSEADRLLTDGMRMMAFIGFVMLAAQGFASVIQETGHVEVLVSSIANLIGGNKALGSMLMLIVGLLVTMGIGSSFSTIPIIAVIYVPLCLELGFSPLATISLIGTAAALGDAGSPASDSTLGPTAGLNVDNQHHHIWDTCVPTFIHYNIPLIIFGWIASMIL
jgi:putative amino acid transporter